MTKAIQQGELDGLCGIYATVNAINHLMVIAPPGKQSEDLFAHAARALPRKLWPEVLWAGTTLDQMLRMVKAASRHMLDDYGVQISASLPFSRRRFSHRDRFIREMEETPEHAVFILWIDWSKWGGSHWTVFDRAADDHLKLKDSAGNRKLDLSYLGVRGETGRRIAPRSTIKLTLDSIDGVPVRVDAAGVH